MKKNLKGTQKRTGIYDEQLRSLVEMHRFRVILSQFVYVTKINILDYIIKEIFKYIVKNHLISFSLVINTVKITISFGSTD